ncbi:hypothetical protein [Burkholderia pseudomultivorans]|nr:hypothetical protein [Burkholderia pseudomultivorans]
MKTTRKFSNMSLVVLIAAAMAAIVSTPAMAGGLDSGTSAVTNFKIWFYGLVGIGASVYLVYKAAECWGDRASWTEFGKAVAWVAAAGGTAVLAPWAWNLFVN